MIGCLAVGFMLTHESPTCAKPVADDGIWRWDSAGCAVEVQDVIRGPGGKRLSDEETQRVFAKAEHGIADYRIPGLRYVPYTVHGEICVWGLKVWYGDTDRWSKAADTIGMFRAACSDKGKMASGLARIENCTLPLTKATAVVAVVSGLGDVVLRRKEVPK
jgi:hypothetical protein